MDSASDLNDTLRRSVPLHLHSAPMGNSKCLDRSSHERPATRIPFPIAIVGMAMRLPGGVNCDSEFWDFLTSKRDGLCKVPQSRYNIDAFHQESTPGTVRTQHGYFLQQDISKFDTAFFGMSKVEASKLDPQQRMLLEVIWECMENGAQTEWCGTDIGCYVGVFGEDWLDLQTKDPQAHDRYRVIGASDFALSNRVSYEFDLKGPSITYRTGCSSALVGLHEACQALYSGECSSALVAGTNLIITPTMSTTMSDNMVISESGICRTFDAGADGYGRGEAVNAIYIKPLDAALRDGDPVRAVIRSTSVNCDGRTPSITTPGSEAQERLIKSAYHRAGIEDIHNTGFFECHGTGTIVGDTAETSVVAKIFGKHGIHIGAIKPNVGHSEGASGITSVIKCALALEHKAIPPNVHFHEPNPKIPFKEAGLCVPVDTIPWPKDRCERASVNSFGIGGTNAHLVLESAPADSGHSSTKQVSNSQDCQLLLFSAKSSKSLDGNIEAIQKYINQGRLHPANLAYTLAFRREHLTHRAYALLGHEGAVSSAVRARPLEPEIIFVFTGQGAQWPGMARELIQKFPKFKEDIKSLDQVLQGLKNPPQWSIEEELCHCNDTSRLQEAQFAQPLCTAIQVALTNLIRDWGIGASAVVGHSSGEIAAAYASGAISANVAITIAYYRGQAMQLSKREGAMAAIGLGRENIAPYLKEGVVVACENSPQAVTLSGDCNIVEDVLEEVQAEEEVFCKRLPVNMAYHSDHMKELGEPFEYYLAPYMAHRTSMLPLFSTVTGEVISDPEKLSAAYWRQNLESPVLFSTAIQRLLAENDKARMFVEIGPHGSLSGPLRQIFTHVGETKQNVYTPTLSRGKDSWRCLLAAAGNLHIHGAQPNLSGLVASAKPLTDLPPYAWDHNEGFWDETRVAHDWRQRKFRHHELLGSRTLESTDLEPTWRNILRLDEVFWLLDHKIAGEIVFPAAGYIAMIGEAIRQVSGSDDYSLKNIFINTALVLDQQGDDGTEIITSLRPRKLADNVDSVWYEFTIITHQNGGWRKHCVGQVRPGPNRTHEGVVAQSYSRTISSDKWYNALEAKGLEYGPHFRGLQAITASPSSSEAAAVMQETEVHNNRSYALHPTMIDQCLQLLSVAATQGITRRMTRLCVPTAFEDLYIAKTQGPKTVNVSCRMNGNTMEGNAELLASGQVALSMSRGFFFSIADSATGEEGPPLISTIHWKPHIDFLASESALSPIPPDISEGKTITQLTRLFILETYHQTVSLCPKKDHLKKYHNWIGTQYMRILQDAPDLVPEMRDRTAEDPSTRLPEIKALVSKAKNSSLIQRHIEAVFKTLENIQDILENKVSALDLFMEHELLQKLYDRKKVDLYLNNFLGLLGHKNPSLRVLEVGAGTGGTTMAVLKALTSNPSHRMYAQYTYTDISPGFFPQAKQKFKEFGGMEYLTLDISNDPTTQGFEEESFDLIIASNVLHATPIIKDALANVRKLLAPWGQLLLQEVANSVPMVDYMMGTLPGWWAAEDGREKPYLTPEEWHLELLEAGFTGTDAVRYDNEPPYQLNVNMLSRIQTQTERIGEVGLLSRDPMSGWAKGLARVLSSRGFQVKWMTLDDFSATSHIIVILDLHSPFFASLTDTEYSSFQRFCSQTGKGSMLWLTRSVQMSSKELDPHFGLSLGVLRALRQELGRNITSLEIDHLDGTAAEAVADVFEKSRGNDPQSSLSVDYEFALHQGIVNVGRYQWSTLGNIMASAQHTRAKALRIECPGVLSTLTWALECRDTPLGPDDVEVDIKYVGLNFRDIMISMGLMGPASELGCEGSGVVRRIGAAVTNLRVGEQVALIGVGLYATRKIMPSQECIAIPGELSLEDTAAVQVVYVTVIYSLLEVGKLEKGQSVLIHSACGGIGLAAIQICRLVGADIFATVGSDDKVQYLTQNLHIPEDHIFNSRNASFLEGIKKMTDGRGVDIVLNSLSGELLHASWSCVAPLGKMIELGKRDILGHGTLDMSLFSNNRSYLGVDILTLLKDAPQRLQPILQKFVQYVRNGKITAIRPVTVYEATDVVDAFRHMQSGKHMGKVLIRLPEDPSTLSVTKLQQESPLFRSDASYLLVGGFGGIGRAVATWMVERGARNFVILSRSTPESPRNRAFLEDLRKQADCQITTVVGNVSSLDDTKRAVSAAKRPIAGVFQLSMVLRDRNFQDMAFPDWISVLEPKVQGTWNLHHALDGLPLEFFVLVSSISGLLGNTGQTNYAAANAFLDSFVHYRHSQGLPASVIDLGLVRDIGYVAENSAKMADYWQRGSWQTLGERDILDVLELAILADSLEIPHQMGIGMGTSKPLSEITTAPWWRNDSRFAGWSNVLVTSSGEASSRDEELRGFLSSIKQDPSLLDEPSTESRITYELGRMIASHMSYPEDMSLDELSAIAIDSLMTIEIRAWFRRHAKTDLPLVEIANAGTVGGLSKTTIRILRQNFLSSDTEGNEMRSINLAASEDEELNLCLKDKDLGKDMQPNAASVENGFSESEGRVFLTGSTGFMGAFFLGHLAGLPQVKEIACLVRAPDTSTGTRRIKQTLAKYGLSCDLGSKLRVITGDITHSTLGLTSEQFEELAQWASAVYHLAVYSNYSLPYSSHRDANVIGLHNMLQFTNTGRLKPFHYASSISASGASAYFTGQTIPEDGRPLFDITHFKQHIGYTHSKVVAENIAWNAIACGLPVTIYRPGLVTGHSVTGACKAEDFVNRLIANCMRIKCYPVAPKVPNQFVPVDFVCSAMLQISLSSANCCHAFNIVRPDQTKTTTWEEAFEILSQACTPPLRQTSATEWLQVFSKHGDNRSMAGLSILEDKLDENMVWWGLDGSNAALYETTSLCHALRDSPELLEVPTMSELIKTYIPVWESQA